MDSLQRQVMHPCGVYITVSMNICWKNNWASGCQIRHHAYVKSLKCSNLLVIISAIIYGVTNFYVSGKQQTRWSHVCYISAGTWSDPAETKCDGNIRME